MLQQESVARVGAMKALAGRLLWNFGKAMFA
jgi:hypothetical protein